MGLGAQDGMVRYPSRARWRGSGERMMMTMMLTPRPAAVLRKVVAPSVLEYKMMQRVSKSQRVRAGCEVFEEATPEVSIRRPAL